MWYGLLRSAFKLFRESNSLRNSVWFCCCGTISWSIIIFYKNNPNTTITDQLLHPNRHTRAHTWHPLRTTVCPHLYDLKKCNHPGWNMNKKRIKEHPSSLFYNLKIQKNCKVLEFHCEVSLWTLGQWYVYNKDKHISIWYCAL